MLFICRRCSLKRRPSSKVVKRLSAIKLNLILSIQMYICLGNIPHSVFCRRFRIFIRIHADSNRLLHRSRGKLMCAVSVLTIRILCHTDLRLESSYLLHNKCCCFIMSIQLFCRRKVIRILVGKITVNRIMPYSKLPQSVKLLMLTNYRPAKIIREIYNLYIKLILTRILCKNSSKKKYLIIRMC